MTGRWALAATFALAACAHTVEVKPVEVRPIHMTIDVNLRIEREVEEFFDFEEKYEEPAEPEGGAE